MPSASWGAPWTQGSGPRDAVVAHHLKGVPVHLTTTRRGGVRRLAALAVAAPLLVAGMTTPATGATAGLDTEPVLDLALDGSFADSSALAHPVTVRGHNGAAATDPANYGWIDGVTPGTQALELRGNAYLDLGTSTALQPQDLTVSFWLKPTAALSGEHVITWNKQAYNSDGWYLSSEGATSPLALSIGPGGSQPYKVAVASTDRAAFFPVGEWTHVVATYDSTTKAVTFYRNGEPVPSTVAQPIAGASTGVLGSSETLPKTIGFNGPQYNGAYLRAGLDEYRLYDDVAALTDVVALYEESGRTIDRQAVAQSDADALSVPETVTVGVILPTTGSRGSDITWTSSDTGVIAADGTVTRPAEGEPDAEVTLTASVAYAGGTPVVREFAVVVPAATTSTMLGNSGLAAVDVDDAYLTNAAAKEHEYLLTLDSEKFLFEFYRVAGLTPPTAEGYPGWERSNGTNFRGHAFGHYMSALAQAYASSRDADVKAQLLVEIEEAVAGLTEVQDAYAATKPASAGYISAFRESALDRVEGIGTSDENVLVPYYNLHKVLAGLLHINQYVDGATGDQALDIAHQFGSYLAGRVERLNGSTVLLNTEYGGMNDALYDLYALTGDPRIETAAQGFDEVALFRQLAAGQDVLNGKHANTTIPKLIGALKRYTVMMENPELYEALTEQEKADLPMYRLAAENFFRIVVDHHTYVIGSNSQSEHFHGPDLLHQYAAGQDDYQNSTTSETCNEYNMLKLARELFRLTKDVQYAHYYENTFLNTIVSSQNPDTGMTTYFQPMAPGYAKIYAQPFTDFWCCWGTGIENFTKLGDSIYFTDAKNVYVNMFLSSTFDHGPQNLRLTQEANMPTDDVVTFRVAAIDGTAVGEGTTLRLRVPDWIEGAPVLTVNGEERTPTVSRGYVVLEVAAGDVVTYRTPMKVQLFDTPDNPDFVALKYGPTVLSASLGTDAVTATNPNGILVRVSAIDPDAQKIITVSSSPEEWKADLAANVVRIEDSADGQVQFALNGTEDSEHLVFTPHYRRHGERYGLYMTLEAVDSPAAQQRILDAKEILREDEISVDSLMSFDANNSENAKNLQASASSEVATWQGQSLRHAPGPDGWFSYDLEVDPTTTNYLGTRLYSGDSSRNWTLTLSDGGAPVVVNQRPSTAAGTNVFYWDERAIPTSLTQIDENTRYKVDSTGERVLDENGDPIPVVRVRFDSTGGYVGGIFGLRVRTTDEYGTASALSALSVGTGELAPAFAPDVTSYTVHVPEGATSLDLDADPHTPSGLVRVDGVLIDDTRPRTVALDADGSTQVVLQSFAQDHTTSTTYTLTVVEGEPQADTTPPTVSAAVDAEGRTVTITGTDESAGAVTVEYRLGTTGDWLAYTGPVAVGDAAVTVQFRATDAAGNVSTVGSVDLPAVEEPEPWTPPVFVDVQPGHRFYTDIRWLADNGLSLGTVVGDDTWFYPTAPISRQAMAAFMYRYAGSDWTPAEGTQTFSDVGPEHQFYVQIEWMVETGLAGGYVDGTYKPTSPVSRQAMAAFLHRMADSPEPTGTSSFTDVTAANEFAEAIAWLEEAEIAEGYTDGTFGITRPVTRQAMAAFLHRFDQLVG